MAQVDLGAFLRSKPKLTAQLQWLSPWAQHIQEAIFYWGYKKPMGAGGLYWWECGSYQGCCFLGTHLLSNHQHLRLGTVTSGPGFVRSCGVIKRVAYFFCNGMRCGVLARGGKLV